MNTVFVICYRTVCTELTSRVKKAVVQLSLLCFEWTRKTSDKGISDSEILDIVRRN